ncbi:MAG: AAA family ATPase [Sterolibacteriaceae bacterium]|nr:AAA family ATPase [Sterolibacteriaceae bacterium]
MTSYGAASGIAIVAARVRDFRSLANIEVELNDLTVLIGANNAGKTSFLDALFAAIGAGTQVAGRRRRPARDRRVSGAEDA